MLHGLYDIASGLQAQETRLESAAHNLANINTTGFQRQVTTLGAFSSHLSNASTAVALPGGSSKATTSLASTTLAPLSAIDTSAGVVRATGNHTDLAIHGDGYFAIQNGNREAYTRNGAFTLDLAGHLVTSDGLPVLGNKGPVTITSAQWEVRPNGEILVNGAVTDTIKIVTLDPDSQGRSSLSTATRLGNSEWQASTVRPATAFRVEQGALEGSNVNSISEMVSLMTITRQFEANQRCLLARDSMLERSVNDIARV